ncbi:MAG: metal-dependent transcriptional regulator [Flavobacteriales bacterium]|nr:metal-dependent transcriptional regulator [Flavobacteriales bacterium]
MLSFTEENYLKAIFSINEHHDNAASTNAIAERLNTKAASVSDMLKKLKEKKLINYQKYKAVTLTESGSSIAISIIRKHRLWEFFLVEKLHFSWDAVHDIAEQLEHIQSKELTNKLDEFLGFPEFDPHGDPIPNKDGDFPLKLDKTLVGIKTDQKAKVLGVKDHSTEFLTYLTDLGISLGTLIRVHKINAYDNSLEIYINDKPASISNTVAQNLFVKLISE